MRAMTGAVVLLAASGAQAHTAYLESGLAGQAITRPAEAKLVFGYLEEGEYDVYPLFVSPDDRVVPPWGGPPMATIIANVLPPACVQYVGFHPSVALLMPTADGLEIPSPSNPFPAGYNVIVADNPKESSTERPIYTEKPDLFNGELEESGCDIDERVTGNLSWFLPYGLTQHCLHCDPAACNYRNSLVTATPWPGMYYLVVYDDTGRIGDYSLNIGNREGETTCEDLQRTVDIIEGIHDGSVYRIRNCVSAGESGYSACY